MDGMPSYEIRSTASDGQPLKAEKPDGTSKRLLPAAGAAVAAGVVAPIVDDTSAPPQALSSAVLSRVSSTMQGRNISVK